jgi:hypothetical protein
MELDVSYHSISRPLVGQIEDLNLPAKIRILRLPTLSQLRNHLREHPHHYHILHFDRHGSCGGAPTYDTQRAFDLKGAGPTGLRG